MIWLGLGLSAALAYFLTAWVRRVALARDLLDVPNQRSSHSVEMPRGGGVAIVVVFTGAMAGFAATGHLPFSTVAIFMLAGGWIAIVGLIDDVRHVPARWRLVAHFVGAAAALLWLGGMPPIRLGGVNFDLAWVGHGTMLVFLVWLLNLYNFMDGIDGIAAIEAITVGAGGAIVNAIAGAPTELWLAPLLLASATSGFLFWNFPRARIFMGDAGSGFIGFVLGLFLLLSGGHSPDLTWCWLILLGAFIVDATTTLIRRVKRGEKFYQAHRSHAYQYAARKFRNHAWVSLSFGLLNLLWLLPLAILVAAEVIPGAIGLGIAYLPLLILAYAFRAGAKDLQKT